MTVSRTHPGLVKKLFALEVPEIADGSVEIVDVAREAGHRSKIAVRTSVSGLNAKGACIGPMGQRVRNVVFATTLEVDVKIVRIKANVGAATFPENGTTLQAVMTVAQVERPIASAACAFSSASGAQYTSVPTAFHPFE